MSLDQEAAYARTAMAHMLSDEELVRLLDDVKQRERDLELKRWMDAFVAICGIALLCAITPIVLDDQPAPVVAEVRK